jgi:hypothetical protein
MRLLVAFVMFFMVPVVFAVVDLPSPSVGEAKQKIEEAQLDKAKSQENQPVVRVIKIKSVASQDNADYKTDEENTNPNKPGDYTLLLSVLTVIFTGALVITGVLQYCVYKAQAKIMGRELKAARLSAKAAQDSAVAAVKSADAAMKNAEVALLQTKIMENLERPWVVVNPTEVYRRQDTPITSYEFKWAAENVGSSPAFLTELTGDVKVVPYPIPDELPKYPEKEPFAQFIISPHKRHKSEERGFMSPSDLTEFREGKKALAFYGVVKYNGAFSGPHCTRFYTYWVYEEGSLIYYPVGPPNTVKYT